MTTETRTLIDQAKAALVSKPKATKDNRKAVEAADAILTNELLARLNQIKTELKTLKAEEDELKAILTDAIGTGEELTVHGAKVASIARWRQVDIVSEKVKELFSVAEYPELYKASNRSRLTVH
jgi:ABC-type phosphate transport system auxiliary subunit